MMTDAGSPSVDGTSAAGTAGRSRLDLVIATAGSAMLVGAGLLLWASQMDALSATYLVSALAGCF